MHLVIEIALDFDHVPLRISAEEIVEMRLPCKLRIHFLEFYRKLGELQLLTHPHRFRGGKSLVSEALIDDLKAVFLPGEREPHEAIREYDMAVLFTLFAY